MWPGFNSWTQCHMWVEFVVGSRPCSERFFSGYSGFSLSSKTNIILNLIWIVSPITVEPVYNGHPRDLRNWPLNTGGRLKGQYHAIFSNTLKIGKTLIG